MSRAVLRSLLAATALLGIASAVAAQADTTPAAGALTGRPVRVDTRPGTALPSRLTGAFLSLARDSVRLSADSVQLIRSRSDSTRVVRLPCARCVEAQLALSQVARIQVATVAPPDRWKRTRRHGVWLGALIGTAAAAGGQALWGDAGKVPQAAIPGAVLGAWLGGSIGAAWPYQPQWHTIYDPDAGIAATSTSPAIPPRPGSTPED